MDCNVGTCSQTCGGGKKTCQRQCLNGVFGDVECPLNKETKEEDCNQQTCGKINKNTENEPKKELWVIIFLRKSC